MIYNDQDRYLLNIIFKTVLTKTKFIACFPISLRGWKLSPKMTNKMRTIYSSTYI